MGKQEASELMRITKRSLQDHENGKHLRAELVKRYAAIYHVDPHWLMTGESSPAIVTEDPGLYGRTSELMVNGRPVKVTTFEPKGGPEQPAPDVLIREALAAIMDKDREIQRLRSDLDDLRKKVDAIHRVYLSHAASKQSDEIRALLKELDNAMDKNNLGEKSR